MVNKLVQPDVDPRFALDDWATSFLPSDITFLDLKTGRELHEPSLAAVKRSLPGPNQKIGELFLAAGSDALAYQDAAGAAVFSPLRQGQVADYTVAQHMLACFYKQLRPSLLSALLKPVIYVHTQEHTTEVEKTAITEAMIQTGARKVILYSEALPDFLARMRSGPMAGNACVLHIEPRD